MRRVYLSFLGTSDYLHCNYIFKEHKKVENVRFVQEAGVTLFCSDWTKDDKILIFTTDEAHEKNWLDNGHCSTGDIACEGLEKRLSYLKLNVPYEEINIPSGKTEAEIWVIFNTVIQQLQDGDKLHLDVTHAFRSLPMLAMVILGYVKVMQNISVQTICYGAMEALGLRNEVLNMDDHARNVPIFDLLPFDQLQDWVIAIDRFTGTGDAKLIKSLAMRDIEPILVQTKGKDPDAGGMRKLAEALEDFSSAIATCRGKEIGRCADNLRKTLGQVHQQQIVQPIKPLIKKLDTVIEGFAVNKIAQGVAAARWCNDHNLFQQGYTILQETLVSFIIFQTSGSEMSNITDRTIVGQALNILNGNILEANWKSEAKINSEKVRNIITWLTPQSDLRKCMRDLTNCRNDINHCGMKQNPMKPDTIVKRLYGFITTAEGIIERTNNKKLGSQEAQ